MKDINIYSAADQAIQIMNRDMLRDFGKLKTSKLDELHILRDVTEVYRKQAQKARKRYYEIGFEAFLLGLFLCGIQGKKAQQMAEKAISPEWVDAFLKDINLVTGFRFDTETERKAQRLAEALTAESERAEDGASSGGGRRPAAPVSGKDLLIDRAIKDWSRQVGQYAIDITDAALMEAYEAAEMPDVKWISVEDNRRCTECRERHGKIFPLDEVPPKPHWGCRCKLVPAGEVTEEKA